jgi:uncharacterized protein YdeI (YjbR/CyaY-like superfamily)
MANTPKDFAAALKVGWLDEFFSGCTGPHRREYLKWIGEAKRPETRAKRITQSVKLLSFRQAEETACSKKNT